MSSRNFLCPHMNCERQGRNNLMCTNCFEIIPKSNQLRTEESKRNYMSSNSMPQNRGNRPNPNHSHTNHYNQNGRGSANSRQRAHPNSYNSHYSRRQNMQYQGQNMDIDSLYSHSMYPENHNYQMRSNPSQRQSIINRINTEENLYNRSLQRNQHSNYNQAQRNPHNHYVEVIEIEPFHTSDFDDSIPLRGFANDWVSAIPSNTAFDDFFEDFSSFRHHNREIDTFNNRRQRSRGLDLFDSFTQSLFENFFNGFQDRLPVNRPRRHRERNLFEMLLSEFSNLDSFDIRPIHRFVRDPRQQAMDITELLAAMANMHPQGQRPANLNRINNLLSVKMTSTIISSNTTCTVCQEDFKVGEKAKKLTCDHYFHEDCLMPWLQVQNTCPICRNPV